MVGRWARHQPDGGEWLDQDDDQAGRRDHGHRLSVCRRPEDRQAREGGTARRQGDPPLRPLGLRSSLSDADLEYVGGTFISKHELAFRIAEKDGGRLCCATEMSAVQRRAKAAASVGDVDTVAAPAERRMMA